MRAVKAVAAPIPLPLTLGLFLAVSCGYAVSPLPSPPAVSPPPSPTVASPGNPFALAVASDVLQRPSAPMAPDIPVSIATQTKSKAGDSIVFSTRKVVNNLWGAPPDEVLTSAIYVRDDGKSGWEWNRPAPVKKAGQSGVHPIYPSIRIGGSPLGKANTLAFPGRFSGI